MNIEENNDLRANGNVPEEQPSHDNTVDNSNEGGNVNDSDSDQERIDQATRASEASFTLETEKGITPDPDTFNSPEENEGNNVKK